MKTRKSNRMVEGVEEEKISEEGGSQSTDSDDETPEEVSSASMKSSIHKLTKNMEMMKQQLKMAEKAKRKQKQEMFIEQKKAKITKFYEDTSNTNKDDADEDDKRMGDAVESPATMQRAPKPKPTRKIYPDLNIVVEPLTKRDDTRASAALDFKSRRLAKPHRESVQTAVISYQKKLQARK